MNAQTQLQRGGEIPRYKALAPHYIAPHYIPKGAQFSTWAAPTHLVEALNDAATSMLELWYEEDHPAADEKGNKLFLPDGTPKMWKPHAGYRTAKYEAAEPAEVFDIVPPKPDDMTGTLDLATARFAQAVPQAMPAPDPVHTPRSVEGNAETHSGEPILDITQPPAEPKGTRAR